MSTIALSIDRHLQQTVNLTGRLNARKTRSRVFAQVTGGLNFIARGVLHVWRNRRYYTLLKLINMGLVNLQFHYKTERVFGRPYRMKIESTNICNTKCQLCPTGLGIQGRPKGKMEISQYKKLINKLKSHLFGLDLSMWGDPLIVPEIYDMIRYAHDKGIWTYISSNLHAFKPGRGQAKSLVESGLDTLTCSLHGASQHTYEQYQPGKDFDEAVQKVRHIIETRDKMNSSTPEIQLNFVVTRHNEHERDDFKRLAEKLGCKAVFSTAAMNVRFQGKDNKLQSLGLAPDLVRKKTKEHLSEWLPQDKRYVLEPYQAVMDDDFDPSQYNGSKAFNCNWPWQSSVINWDGQVVTCCGSFDPSEDMGNAFEKPFGKIWNGRQYRMARRSFTKKVAAEDCKDNPCTSCPGFML